MYTNALTILERLKKHLKSPALGVPPSTVRLLEDWLVPLLDEVVSLGAETADNMAQVAAYARAAFDVSRKTLGGELIETIAGEALDMRALIDTLPDSDFKTELLGHLDEIDGATNTFQEALLSDDEDDEADEEEGTDKPAGGSEIVPLVAPVQPAVAPVLQVVSTLSAPSNIVAGVFPTQPPQESDALAEKIPTP